ncbi:DUF4215 domain-containing protein [Nannocystis sp. SCPEA4]|uniref:DUF4215 domain-containing protein n=1 Tax=Nannocystis sp. SCPEA4 TaxID=2996787 RepID=UPI002271793F|nr:DUF4215 domain-containing protein [Nannocystis sp. SCPEA4]MCY1056738.1 DUF4215 domain-containing protein [Nannocystis sp. SCPEA4]
MSRIRTLLPAALLLGGCTAPGLKYIDGFDQTTGDSDTTTSGSSSEAESTSIMTSTEGSDSGDASHSGTTMTTTDAGTGTTTTTTADTTTTSTGGEPFCGDGLVEGDEECDDANDIADDRCFECTKNRWVFASAAFHNTGALGGIEGADSLCRQYALQSGKADDSWKTFIAWLSDADHDVRDRLYPGRGRYVRTDGVVVAETLDRFFSGSIAASIDVDELGNQEIGGIVITGTRPDGTAAPGTHCDNWTTEKLTDFSAYIGVSSATDESWTMHPNPDVNPQPCTALSARLYCIEGE